MKDNHSGRSWIEIDLKAIEENYYSLQKLLQPQVRILGVVKANAYGHGALEVSRLLSERGIHMLGVTTVEEGISLRQSGIQVPILVFGPFLPEEAALLVEHQLTGTIASLESLAWLEEAAKNRGERTPVHLKVETGMGRLGFWPQEALEAARRIKAAPSLALEGVYSHLAIAMEPRNSSAQRQIKIFQMVLTDLQKGGIEGYTAHLANSGAIINYPEAHFDMVRAGTLLYGQAPAGVNGKIRLQDPWSLKTRVLYLKDLPPGWGVGYGRTDITKRKTRLAVLGLGYTDGISLEPVFKTASLSQLIRFLGKTLLRFLGLKKVSIPVSFPEGTGYVIGKPGMQLTMVDVTGIPGIEAGTPACIKARRTAVSAALPRVYLQDRTEEYGKE